MSDDELVSLRAIGTRGAIEGDEMRPVRNRAGKYVTSPDKYARNQKYHDTLKSAVESMVTEGHGIRMSRDGKGKNASLRKFPE